MPHINPLPRLHAALAPLPSPARDAGALLLTLALTWLLGFAVHMLDAPKWQAERFRVDGEYIQATHDAYHWLAGAVGMDESRTSPMAELARLGADTLDVLPGNFSFYAPVVAAGFAGCAVALLAWSLGCLEAGLLAGVFTMLAPGFFYRTRLGYYDTDMVTLLFPLLLCWGLIQWTGPHLYRDWKTGLLALRGHATTPEDAPSPPGVPALLAMLLLGGAARYFGLWHQHIELFGMLLYCMSLGLALLMALPGRRGALLLGLALFGLCAYLGRPGLFIAAGVAMLTAVLPPARRLLTRTAWPGLVLTLAVLLQSGLALDILQEGLLLVERYSPGVQDAAPPLAAPQASDAAVQAPDQTVQWPEVMPSVLEAQTIGWRRLLLRIHPWTWTAVAGLAGFVLSLMFRPLLVFLLPLFVLSLASLALGGRMAMFAAPVAGLGLGLPLCWLGRALLPQSPPKGADWRRPVLMAMLGGATVLLMAPSVRVFAALRPMPVLQQEHARALSHLGHVAEPGAMIWTWWDWGYATQYYARRASYADGGNQSGKRIYPLALALTSPSPLLSRQIINYSAVQDYTPWKQWDDMSPEEMRRFLSRLSATELDLQPKPPQYLVVSIENLHLLHWITYYGSWNFSLNRGVHASLTRLDQTFDVDYTKGLVSFPNAALPGGPLQLALKSVDAIHDGELHHRNYPQHPQGRHLIVENSSHLAYLLDDQAYDSQAVQLLLSDTQNLEIMNNFALVYDGFPVVRVYRVK